MTKEMNRFFSILYVLIAILIIVDTIIFPSIFPLMSFSSQLVIFYRIYTLFIKMIKLIVGIISIILAILLIRKKSTIAIGYILSTIALLILDFFAPSIIVILILIISSIIMFQLNKKFISEEDKSKMDKNDWFYNS